MSSPSVSPSRPPRLTLAFVFSLTGVGIAVLVGVLFYAFLEASRTSIVESAKKLQRATAQRIEERVKAELGQASAVIDDFERLVRLRAVRVDEPLGLEARLFSELVTKPRLMEVTLTFARRTGFGLDKSATLAPGNHWQLSVFRSGEDPASAIHTRRIDGVGDGDRYVTDERHRAPGGLFESAALRGTGVDTKDPADDDTFKTPARAEFDGQTIWTDLHRSKLDKDLPRDEQRVEVSALKAIHDRDDRFVGVLRVGISTRGVDDIVEPLGDAGARIFLCDERGRLITRLSRTDAILADPEPEGDLRVVAAPSPEIAMALEDHRRLGEGDRTLDVGGEIFLATFRSLQLDKDGDVRWTVGIVVPEKDYTKDLLRMRRRFLVVLAGVVLLILIVFALTLRALRRGLGAIVAATGRIRQLDFSAGAAGVPFRDVHDVMDGLERAKTVMRAIGKYVPVDLVRQLFKANKEPALGGELMTITLMFTDIRGFTELAEKLSPDELAQKLGCYLETMTAAITETHGTIDKFIGDAVMAIWNAPTPVPNHAREGCRAALACIAGAKKLYASSDWEGLPALHTRFGLHKDRVMVGHFGAPERLSYTALGDGVNLAARLEALCKHYGITVMVSQTIEEEARGLYEFRALDFVAVKGKSHAVKVFELLGEVGGKIPNLPAARAYERALESYLARDFEGALAILEAQPDDPPSAVLAERCRAFSKAPPPPDWAGVYVATSK